MVRRSESTRAAILAAAVAEFAERGFSGARIDRIAEAAVANKRMIYVYFDDKDGLFAQTLRHVLAALVEAVPITEDDLPGYARHLFDYLVEHPEALRLTMWRHLERPDAGPEVREVYTEKITSMRDMEASPGSSGAAIAALDLLVLVQGMTNAWLISPLDLLLADSTEPMSEPRLAAHRAALGEAVRRIVGDGITPQPNGDQEETMVKRARGRTA